jgi:hypothetical protein
MATARTAPLHAEFRPFLMLEAYFADWHNGDVKKDNLNAEGGRL